jgi:serine/threonine protein kinase
MPAPATVDEFLDLVRKSGVADESRLDAHLKKLAEQSGLPGDPSKLAGVLVRDGLLTYFQADQLLQGKWKRFFIGKYKVLERIGTGGMGQVFLCEHKLMRRRVAVKVLPAAKAADPSSLERFYREARAVAALDHPNIVRAYDIDQDEGLHFLVMEYVDGTNLQDLVKKFGPLDVLRACHYVYGAAVGLQHAFELGLVHRDIKPGNVLIDRSGVVKILDMGLARFFNDDEDALTRKYDETVLGTADYLAPEQALDSHVVDIRADVYGLGGTFFFLLTGQPPFPEGTVAQKLLWHQTREPASLRALRPDVPPALAAVVAKMMAKDPAKRYQTPAELMAALADWVQTPIPPPADKEMPQLSPAATGPAAGPTASRVFSGPPTVVRGTSITTSNSTPAASYPAAGNSDATTPTPRPSARAATPATSMPPAAPVPVAARPAAPAPGGVWAHLAAAETRPGLRADTDRTRRPARPSQHGPAKPAVNRLVLLAVLGGVPVLLLLAGGAYLLFGRKSAPGGTAAGEAKTWYVSAHAGPDPARTLRNLADALDRAGTGDTVLILDDRIDDPAPVTVSKHTGVKKGVRIEAGTPSKTVVWSPRTSTPQRGVLEVLDAEDFHVSGLILDLGGSAEYGVLVGRSCPGLVVEDVTVQSPRIAGFRIVSAAGEPGRPIRMTRCRVAATGKLEGAVQLLAGCRHVIFEGGRLEGPGKAAVQVDGAVEGCEVRNNRVYKFDVGVSLTGKPADAAGFDLTVANNTFHTIGNAGVAIEAPLAGLNRFSLARNYFAATREIATSSADPGSGFIAADNARDRATREGKLPTNATAVTDYEMPPPRPGGDGEFLRPAPGRLGAIGPNKVAVGAQQ